MNRADFGDFIGGVGARCPVCGAECRVDFYDAPMPDVVTPEMRVQRVSYLCFGEVAHTVRCEVASYPYESDADRARGAEK